MGRWTEHVNNARKAYVDKDMKQVLEQIGLAEQAASTETEASKQEASKVITAFKNFLGPIHQAAAEGQISTPEPAVDPNAELHDWCAKFVQAKESKNSQEAVHWGAKLLERLNPDEYAFDSFYDGILSGVATSNMRIGCWRAAIRPMTLLLRRQVANNQPYSEQLNSRLLLATCLGNSGYSYLAMMLLKEAERFMAQNQCPDGTSVLLDKIQRECVPNYRRGIEEASAGAMQMISMGHKSSEKGNFIQAANSYEIAAMIYMKCFGRSDETTVSAVSMLAEALLRAGKIQEAQAYPELVIAEAARLIEKAWSIADWEIYQTLNDTINKGLNFAQASEEQKVQMEKVWNEFCIFPEKYPETHRLCKSAERMSREAITKLENSGFAVRDLLAKAYQTLATALSAMGQSDDAVKCSETSKQYKQHDYGFILDDIRIDDLPFDSSIPD